MANECCARYFLIMCPELTFIICAPEGSGPSPERRSSLTMIGDVNLFLKGSPEDPEFEVEVEIMIAGVSHRHVLRVQLIGALYHS